MANLNVALQGAWNSVEHLLLDKVGKTATVEQVRQFVREYLDREPQTNANVQKYWCPLSEVEKDDALRSAFADGKPYLQTEESEPE